MSKYESLWKFVKKKNKDELTLSFEEIHKITGFEIDHSFLNFKKELINFGFEVKKISLKENYIIFQKRD